MANDIVIDFDEPVALFPLAQIALLPHATVPLHIFEPRYRAMTRDALAGEGLIAMAMFDGEPAQWSDDYAGNPPIKPCVCVGRIVHHQTMDDGRYNLMLQGLARARLIEELPPDAGGYRLAMVTPTEPEPAMEIDLADHRRRLGRLVHDDRLSKLAMMKEVRGWLDSELPTLAVIDAMSLALCRDGASRYAMLDEADGVARAERLIGMIHETLSVLSAAEPMADRAKSDDGFFLN